MHRVFKEFLLVFVLFLDIGIDFATFGVSTFDETGETFIDYHFELCMIIHVLYHLINCILKVIYDGFIISIDVSIFFDNLLNKTLAHSQIFHHET